MWLLGLWFLKEELLNCITWNSYGFSLHTQGTSNFPGRKNWLISLALFLPFYTFSQFLPKCIINITDYFLKSGIQEKVLGCTDLCLKHMPIIGSSSLEMSYTYVTNVCSRHAPTPWEMTQWSYPFMILGTEGKTSMLAFSCLQKFLYWCHLYLQVLTFSFGRVEVKAVFSLSRIMFGNIVAWGQSVCATGNVYIVEKKKLDLQCS